MTYPMFPDEDEPLYCEWDEYGAVLRKDEFRVGVGVLDPGPHVVWPSFIFVSFALWLVSSLSSLSRVGLSQPFPLSPTLACASCH